MEEKNKQKKYREKHVTNVAKSYKGYGVIAMKRRNKKSTTSCD